MFQNSNVPEFNRVFDRSHLSQSKNSKKHIKKLLNPYGFDFQLKKNLPILKVRDILIGLKFPVKLHFLFLSIFYI
jgi:hypothetical protein